MGSRGTRRGLIALFTAVCSAASAAAGCVDDAAEIRSGVAVARFSIEVADTDAERQLGLMNREKLAASSGMLFVFEAPHRVNFWMKDTLIPLDMIFIDSSGRVTNVHPMAIPQDQTPIDGGDGVAFVLEINGGLAKRLGIAVGSVLRHPTVDQAIAVWRCNSD